MPLQVSITMGDEGSYLITLEGRLDTNTYLDLDEKIRPVLTSSPRLLVFNLEKLDYISSMGIKSIVSARKAVKSKAGHLILLNPQPQIRKVFDIVSALPREAIFSSRQEADRFFDMIQKKEIEKPKNSN
jgi:anti-sigma B factor antagonist